MGSDLHTIIGNCIGGLGFLGLSITLFLRTRSDHDNVTAFPQKLAGRSEAGEVRSLLASGAQRLGLAFAAFIRFEKNKNAKVVEVYTSRYSQALPLKKGQSLDLSHLYCERFLRGNDLLAIDYASLSTWREHEGFKSSGVESYLGVAIKVNNEVVGSLSFFDEQARDQFFSSSEKDFVRSLGEKLSAKLAKEAIELVNSDALVHSSTASVQAEIL